jgi:hypothetical protein
LLPVAVAHAGVKGAKQLVDLAIRDQNGDPTAQAVLAEAVAAPLRGGVELVRGNVAVADRAERRHDGLGALTQHVAEDLRGTRDSFFFFFF